MSHQQQVVSESASLATKPSLGNPPVPRGPGRPRKKSQYYGVSRNQANTSRPWQARVTVNGETRYLGSFTLEEDAAIAVDDAIIKYNLNPNRINFPTVTADASSATTGAASSVAAMTTSPSSGSNSNSGGEDEKEDPYAVMRAKSYLQEPPPLHALLASPTMKNAFPTEKAFPTATSLFMPPPPPSPRLMMSNKRSFSVGGPGSASGVYHSPPRGGNIEDIRQKKIGALWRTSYSPSFQQDEGIKKQVRKTMRAVQNGEADSLLAGIFTYGNYKEDQYPELAIMLLTEFGWSSPRGKSSP